MLSILRTSFAILTVLLQVAVCRTVTGTELKISTSFGFLDGDVWREVGNKPSLSLGTRSEYRLEIATNKQAHLAVCAIGAFGEVIPIWPWIDEKCAAMLPNGDQGRTFLAIDERALHRSMSRTGKHYDGVYAFLILAHDQELPKWTHLHQDFQARQFVHRSIATPMFSKLSNAQVDELITLTDPRSEIVVGLLTHYQDVVRKAVRQGYSTEVIVFALDSTVGRDEDRAVQVYRANQTQRLALDLVERGQLRDAFDLSSTALAEAELVFGRHSFPNGHPSIIKAHMVHATVCAFSSRPSLALQHLRSAQPVMSDYVSVSPDLDTLILEAKLQTNLAGQLLGVGVVDEAAAAAKVACEMWRNLSEAVRGQAEYPFIIDMQIRALACQASALRDGHGETEDIRRTLDEATALLTELPVEATSPPRFLTVRAKIEALYGLMCFQSRDFESAELHLQKSIDIYELHQQTLLDDELTVYAECIQHLVAIYLYRGDVAKARKVMNRLASLVSRARPTLQAPYTTLRLLFCYQAVDAGLLGATLNEDLAETLLQVAQSQESRVTFSDWYSRSSFLSLAETMIPFDPDLAREICMRAESAARMSLQDTGQTNSRLHVVRALLALATLDLDAQQSTHASLRFHQAIRELGLADMSQIDVDERLDLLLRASEIAARVGDEQAAHRLYDHASQLTPDWERHISHSLLSRAACDAQRRRWKEGETGVSDEFTRAWAREVDYSWTLLALSRFGENQEWAERHERYSNLILAAALADICTPETAYHVCATRKRLANEAAKVWRSLLAQDNDRSRTLRQQIVAAQRRAVADLYWPNPSAAPSPVVDQSGLYTRDAPLHWQAVELANDQLLLERRAKVEQHDWRQFPPHAVVIDFFRRRPADLRQAGGEQHQPYQYFAFVLQRDRRPTLVHLGNADPLDQLAVEWRAAIRDNRHSSAPQQLRAQLWQQLEQHFAPGTKRVYICPEGALATLPWSALPGRDDQSVLLEDYALALLPHGLALVDVPLLADAPSSAPPQWLLVGNIDYSAAHISEGDHGTAPPRWPALPGTQQELDAVADLAADAEVVRVEGAKANTDELLRRLPHADWVHIATHGFFAGTDVPGLAQRGHVTRQARYDPLQLSGLVLAGANRPPAAEASLPDSDSGLLTGGVIAALSLDQVQTVVLSACQTGIGVTGEGTVGLQRAFHQAGAENVIATLWNVDDQATASLMTLFYYYTHQHGLPPIEALREAQLTMRRHPARAANMAALRGPNFRKAAQQLQDTPGDPQFAPPRLWAGITISGTGD